MKKLIIIVVVLLVLAGSGGAAWWIYFNEEEIDLAEMTTFSRKVPLFVDFDPLVLPIIRDGQVIQHLTFTIIVEISDEFTRQEFYRYRTRLSDAYLTELHALYSLRLVQDRLDVETLLGQRLLKVTRRVVGSDMVNRVLVRVLDKKDLLRG